MQSTAAIDCCVYHEWHDQRELMDYMPAAWREFLGADSVLPGGYGLLRPVPEAGYESPFGNRRAEGLGDRYGDSISSYETLAQAVLNDDAIDAVILASTQGMLAPAHPNVHLALEVTRAVNRWTLERWLSKDSRVFGLVTVPNHLPERAAEEIRSVGKHPQMAGALICANGIGKPFGHQLYEPIFAAACEMGLPIVLHVGGDATPDTLTESSAGGQAATYTEYHIFALHSVMTHVVSMISQGVLERFPALKVVAAGTGVLGLPSLMWRLDGNYRALRREVPWLRHVPSEYFRRQVRMLTYPMDTGPSTKALIAAQEAFDGLGEQLCFASGTPQWDSAEHHGVMQRVPSSWHAAVSRDNSLRTFRLPGRATADKS
jgi:uncharacterized protein